MPEDLWYFTITGGEPTLIGEDNFIEIYRTVKEHLPNTNILLLTNGRTLGNYSFFEKFKKENMRNLRIAIPIHGSIASKHDYITQAKGGFEQTIRGLTNIINANIETEIRIVVSKLNENKELQSQIMAETEFLDYWGISQPNDIQVKWNERRATMLINVYGRTYEYILATRTLTEITVNLNGFFTKDYSIYVTANALYARKSVDKLDIIALEDYSIKELDLSSKGIDFRSIYTMDGSDLLYFAGFQYSTSQSVIGTIDIDGNVEITESTPNPITNIIQIN